MYRIPQHYTQNKITPIAPKHAQYTQKNQENERKFVSIATPQGVSIAIPIGTDKEMANVRYKLRIEPKNNIALTQAKNIVLDYLTSNLPANASQEVAFSPRVMAYIEYLNRAPYYTHEMYTAILEQKLNFLDIALHVSQNWPKPPLPSPTGINRITGYQQRPRVCTENKLRPIISINQTSQLVASNTRHYGFGTFGKVKSSDVYHHDNSISKVATKRIPMIYCPNGQPSYEHMIQNLREYILHLKCHHHPKILAVHTAYFYDDGKLARNEDGSRPLGHRTKMALVLPAAHHTAQQHFSAIQTAPIATVVHDILSIFTQAAEALLAIQTRGHSHNDFKLDNLFIMANGIVQMGDLGANIPNDRPIALIQALRTVHIGGSNLPPEAIDSNHPIFTVVDIKKIDPFAFGVELLHVLSFFFSNSASAPIYISDHQNPRFEDITVTDKNGQVSLLPANPVLKFLRDATNILHVIQQNTATAPYKDIVSALCILSSECLEIDVQKRATMSDIYMRMKHLYNLNQTPKLEGELCSSESSKINDLAPKNQTC